MGLQTLKKVSELTHTSSEMAQIKNSIRKLLAISNKIASRRLN